MTTNPSIQVGFNPHLSLEGYHGHKASWSKSDLVRFASETPLACYNAHFATSEKKKDIFELGTGAHAAILEGLDAYWDRAAIVPDEVLGKNGARSTNAYKAWAEANAHKTILMADQARAVEEIYHTTFQKGVFKRLLTGGIAEMSAFWIEDFNGHPLMCKCRPDYLPGDRIVVDLKTTSDIHNFTRTAYNLKYYWSAYFTCRGLTKLTGQAHTDYYFAVVESVEPFDSMMVQVMPEHFQLAEHEIKEVLPQLAACDRDNAWPGYPDEIMALQMPAYAFKNAPHILEQSRAA